MLYHHLFNKPEIVDMGLPWQLLVGSVPLRGYCFRCGPRHFTQGCCLGSMFLVLVTPWQSLLLPSVSAHPDHQVSIFCWSFTTKALWKSGSWDTELFCWCLTSGQRTASRPILQFLTACRVCASVDFPVYVTIWGWSLGSVMLEGSFCCSLSKFTDAGNHNYLDILCLVNRVPFHWTAVSTIVLQTFAFSR